MYRTSLRTTQCTTLICVVADEFFSEITRTCFGPSTIHILLARAFRELIYDLSSLVFYMYCLQRVL